MVRVWLARRCRDESGEQHPHDPAVQITISILTPFAAYLPAEHMHISGVLAVVSAGVYLGATPQYQRLQQEALTVERYTIIRLRNEQLINDQALRRIQRDLDLAEARLTGD